MICISLGKVFQSFSTYTKNVFISKDVFLLDGMITQDDSLERSVLLCLSVEFSQHIQQMFHLDGFVGDTNAFKAQYLATSS